MGAEETIMTQTDLSLPGRAPRVTQTRIREQAVTTSDGQGCDGTPEVLWNPEGAPEPISRVGRVSRRERTAGLGQPWGEWE